MHTVVYFYPRHPVYAVVYFSLIFQNNVILFFSRQLHYSILQYLSLLAHVN